MSLCISQHQILDGPLDVAPAQTNGEGLEFTRIDAVFRKDGTF